MNNYSGHITYGGKKLPFDVFYTDTPNYFRNTCRIGKKEKRGLRAYVYRKRSGLRAYAHHDPESLRASVEVFDRVYCNSPTVEAQSS